jgi:hypothetical protein
MRSGPSWQGPSPTPEHEIPGEFVSEDLRDDCARFLDELRELVKRRHEEQPLWTAWMQGERFE